MKYLVLSFYYYPDLCAGSFRNTPFVETLSKHISNNDTIEVITTMPNRYSTFKERAPKEETIGNTLIHRIKLPDHKSGIKDQIISFTTFYREALRISKNKKFDKVYASSSRLFTGYLGYKIASKNKTPLFLDIRDIFIDTIGDVFKSKLLLSLVMPVLKNLEKRTFNYASQINLVSQGFEDYFKQFKCQSFSFYTNGIDDVFLNIPNSKNSNRIKLITYAGNIGEGQGLEKIIPSAAQEMKTRYSFVIIGDGGAKIKLKKEIERLKCNNVKLVDPVNRNELLDYYYKSDFLFLHLNNYKAFEKVLPSKLFEYGATDKPVIAGLEGYSAKFVKKNISNSILFQPCNTKDFVTKIESFNFKFEKRRKFVEKFRRGHIMNLLVKDFLKM